jgi:magnesium chelatase family protein
VTFTAEQASERAYAIAERGRRTLLVGAPGCGATMIARRVPQHLPLLTDHERVWLSAEIAGGGLTAPDPDERPFRAPHHTVSVAGLVGKTEKRHRAHCASLVEPWARPCDCAKYDATIAGEVRLAQFGVLFLDELPEFRRSALEALREELVRMGTTAPLIVASAWPCPCGQPDRCSCPALTVARWSRAVANAAELLGLEEVRP